MGFNSVMVVLNDRLHEIEEDKSVGKEIWRAITEKGWPNPNHTYPNYYDHGLQCVGVGHADETQVIIVGQNTGHQAFKLFGYYTDEEILKAWADKLGYDLRKRRGSVSPVSPKDLKE